MHIPGHPADHVGMGTRVAFGAMTAAIVLGVQLMLGAVGWGGDGGGPPQPRAAAEGWPDPASRRGGAAPQPLRSAEPARVSIPAIGVDAPVTGVGLDAEGWVQAPPRDAPHLVGWYEGAASPGARGTAVLVGHVDDATGPAVFYGLGDLRPGDTVDVLREDGRTVRFTVYDLAVYAKDSLPPRVYRDRDHAELRLLTCGGSYAEGSGYASNVVAFARLTGVR